MAVAAVACALSDPGVSLQWLAGATGTRVRMDTRGRVVDNILIERLWRTGKREDIFLREYATMLALAIGLESYFGFCNTERPHQSLGYRTPAQAHLIAKEHYGKRLCTLFRPVLGPDNGDNLTHTISKTEASPDLTAIAMSSTTSSRHSLISCSQMRNTRQPISCNLAKLRRSR